MRTDDTKRLIMSAALLMVMSAPAAADQNAPEPAIRFARDIQPLLAKHCLLCHGPDDAQAGLQLHVRENVLAELDSGERAVVPGRPAESELLKRITSQDSDLRMPPEGEPLSAEEIAALRKWIEDGANWEVHWAYRPLNAGSPPHVNHNSAIRNDIDNFVVAKLESQDIGVSQEADRYVLIKRLYYDLIGLPPEPEEVEAFMTETSPDAYERLVDNLLASRHFGERWGRHWLDMARYADSDGYEKDNHRPDAWRYRDWVIHAINNDMPFDQFTIEQLAGDMLPDATPLQRLATAFHRQTLTNTEGGVDREQFRVAAVMDRTETLGTVWLGLSVGCARCHSHKYDQITQREYYQLFAYFNNADEVNASVAKLSPFDSSVQAKVAELKTSLTTHRDQLAQTFDKWLPQLRHEANAESDQKAAYHPLQEIAITGPEGVTFAEQDDGSYLVGGANPDAAEYTITATAAVSKITGLKIEVLPDDSLGGRGPGRTKHGNFVLNEARLYAAGEAKWGHSHQLPLVSATADFAQDGWPAAHAIDGVQGEKQKGTGWAVSPQFGKPHIATFALQHPIGEDTNHLKIVLSQTYGDQHTIGRFRVSVATGRLPGTGLPEDIRRIVLADSRTAAERERLIGWYQSRDSKSRKLERELQKLLGETMTVRVIGQSNSPRKTHILRRGEFKQPLEEVSTGTFTTLPPIRPRDGKMQSDRLDLARWLVSGENALTPRVVANHVWKHLFGAGIVPTVNDFGVRGDLPSHPRLLDHLAAKLIEKKWSRKALIKYIVMSATYRQSSRYRPDLIDIDPSNRLLYRQNRFRVEAEIIRDITLAASGLLSRKVGGPSVFPLIPKGVTDLTYNSSFRWNTSKGEDRYRRGMYTYFKRTAPHPNLVTFDCPDSNVTNVQRNRSNTPIGALVTLNNETFVEAAQAMAQHVLLKSAATDDVGRIAYALQRCIVREPTDADVADFTRLLETSRQWYRDNPDAAAELIGERRTEGVTAVENAAGIATLRMMLNLDEFVTRE